MAAIGVKMTDGTDTQLDDAALQDLRMRVRGEVLLPGEPKYEESRTVWNGMIERKPGLVVRCTGTADVQQAVLFAREHNLLLSVRSGGHNIAGLGVCDGGMALDLRPMRGVSVDVEGMRVTAQGGCRLGDVDRETQVHGLATVLGFVSLTGIAGLTLGGGFGYLTRKHGWATDNLLGLEVVTADGRVVRASEKENPDLFWAMRGGGGNFGVATSFEFRLHRVGPQVVGGLALYPFEEAERLMRFYRDFTAKAPRELTAVFLIRIAPPAPWIPKEWHGKKVAGFVACHTGPVEQALKDVEPLKTIGKPVADNIAERDYTQMQSILDATQPDGRNYYWKSEWIPSIPDELISLYIQQGKLLPTPFSILIFFPVDGAISALPADATAVGNRDAVYNLNLQTAWDGARRDDAVVWVRNTWEITRRFSTGGVYVNFLTEEEGADRVGESYRDTHSRLAQVKKTWDPTNFFRVNQNIKPAP